MDVQKTMEFIRAQHAKSRIRIEQIENLQREMTLRLARPASIGVKGLEPSADSIARRDDLYAKVEATNVYIRQVTARIDALIALITQRNHAVLLPPDRPVV